MDKVTVERRLAFIAEWYQVEAAIIRTFVITFWKNDNAVEVFDKNTKKTFLRRTKAPELSAKDFFVGSKVNVFGRQFDLIDYADDITRDTLARYRQQGFVLLKTNMWTKYLGDFLKTLIDNEININNGMMVQFTPKTVNQFLSTKKSKNVHASVLMNELLAGPSISFELIGFRVRQIMNKCVQQKTENEDTSDLQLTPSLGAFFESEDVRYGLYVAETEEDVIYDLKFFFEQRSTNIIKECRFTNTTLGIIKPHCLKDGQLGSIVQEILSNGFKITAMRMLLMARINCEEFYEVYRGILPEYTSMVAQLASGVCMCLEIACEDDNLNSHLEFRNLCGPMDPEMAKLLRPHTLRAKFGKSKVTNAVHCTDLPDDTNLELQYLFKILD